MPLVQRSLALTGLLLAGWGVGAWAQGAAPAPTGQVYTCVDDRGRRLTSDRPIPECLAKEQRILNRDGSLRAVVPPTLTAKERAEQEARERKAHELRLAQAEIQRRDRFLLQRYPNEASHQAARVAALDTVKVAMRVSEGRLKALAAERKPLTDESEFYKGKPLPPKLRQALDANDAATEAQRDAMANQEAELVRVTRLYDIELERLKALWGGAPPGSLGPLPSPTAVRLAAPAVSASGGGLSPVPASVNGSR